MMATPTSRRVEAAFNNRNPMLVQQFLSAVVDLGLTKIGATLAQIDSVDLALEALIETVAEDVAITDIAVDFVDAGTVVELGFDRAAPIVGAHLEIYGFTSIESVGSSLTAVIDPDAA